MGSNVTLLKVVRVLAFNVGKFLLLVGIVGSIVALIYGASDTVLPVKMPHVTKGIVKAGLSKMEVQMADFPLAIIADIHGNRWALDAVLRDIQRRHIQQMVNLGDCLLGPLDPAGTAKRLMELNILTIQGNDDRVLLAPPEHLSASTVYTLEHLEQEHLAWIRTFPTTAIVAHEIFLLHGDLSADETYLLEEITPNGVFLRGTASIEAALTHVEQPVILCGHSHLPRTLFLPAGKLIINPGSVGMPAYTSDLPLPHGIESGSPHAKYALLNKLEDGWQVEHVQVPYDWGEAARVALEHGREDWATWIATGRL